MCISLTWESGGEEKKVVLSPNPKTKTGCENPKSIRTNRVQALAVVIGEGPVQHYHVGEERKWRERAPRLHLRKLPVSKQFGIEVLGGSKRVNAEGLKSQEEKRWRGGKEKKIGNTVSGFWGKKKRGGNLHN